MYGTFPRQQYPPILTDGFSASIISLIICSAETNILLGNKTRSKVKVGGIFQGFENHLKSDNYNHYKTFHNVLNLICFILKTVHISNILCISVFNENFLSQH